MNEKSDSEKPHSDEPIVFVIDDEASVRVALSSLFRSTDVRVESFASAAEFLNRADPKAPCCLVLDVRLQGTSGLDFQRQLLDASNNIPIIFITGHGDIAMTVKAMKAGAVDFLVKPFRDQDLLDAVSAALRSDKIRRELDKHDAQMHACYKSLTPREKEVMAHAVRGLMNKQIASEVCLSEVTVKIHRGHAMKKMQAKSFADLVRMAEALGINAKG
ncbi:response regulator transcription factor [Pseudomonas abietaniphila]|uniref:Two component transcriptional regulator, LuxR family n=1 Tax=Pseudomonas abietaniphila TaxID=89065 RepID=A0A1G8PT88_9PSED|nr:response regulator transcription factor [Pseudomonas abietaniphila]SDI95425.1 two component transcriptional regulator, LuxR family [Pseudomonas abietaniphila]